MTGNREEGEGGRDGEEGGCGGGQQGTAEKEAGGGRPEGEAVCSTWGERAWSGMLHATVNGHVFQHTTMINFSHGRSPFIYRCDPKLGKCRRIDGEKERFSKDVHPLQVL